MIETALKLASRFAPNLIERLAGPRAGEVAESVLSLGGLLTGTQDPDEMIAALEEDRDLAHEFRMKTAELQVELANIDAREKDSARARDIALRQAGDKNIRASVLAYSAIGLFAIVTLLLFFVRIEDGTQRDLLLMIFGALLILVKEVYGFEFGSSIGSKNKEAQIDRLTGGRANGGAS